MHFYDSKMREIPSLFLRIKIDAWLLLLVERACRRDGFFYCFNLERTARENLCCKLQLRKINTIVLSKLKLHNAAFGCPDKPEIENSQVASVTEEYSESLRTERIWYKRVNDSAMVVGCLEGSSEWWVTCKGGGWHGEWKDCSIGEYV